MMKTDRVVVRMKTRTLLVLAAGLLSLGILQSSAVALEAQTGAASPRDNSTAVWDGLVVDFQAPQPTRSQTLVDGTPFERLEIPGFGVAGAPGTPALPVQRRLVAVPPGAVVDLEVTAAEPVPLPGALRPLPMPLDEPVWPDNDPLQPPAGTVPRYHPDAGVYARDAWLPEQVVRIADRGTWRGVDFVTLEFAPVQVNAGRQAARYVARAKAKLTFRGEAGGSAVGVPSIQPDRLAPLLEGLFVNPDQARLWQRRPDGSGTGRPSKAMSEMLVGVQWRIEVHAAGLQRLTRDDLVAAGVPVDSLDPRRLHLTWKDQPVALWIAGEADGAFDAGDVLYFYAPPPGDKWADYDVYWLSLKPSNGLRMGARDATPGAEPVVDQVPGRYSYNPPNRYLSYNLQSDEKWFHSTMLPSTQVQFPRPADFVASSEPVTLTLSLGLHPSVTVARKLSANLNGTPIAQNVDWPFAPAFFFYSAAVPSTDIAANNTLDVTASAVAFFDAVEMDYRRALLASDGAITFAQSAAGRRRFEVSGLPEEEILAFNVTTPSQPVRLTGGVRAADTFSFASDSSSESAYHVTAVSSFDTPDVTEASAVSRSLLDTSYQVDYLAISPPEFIDALQPLLDRREAQGLRTLVADVTQAYDEFGDGTPDPEAIRAFTSYAYHNWAVRPTYLLLVGDATYDPLDYLGTGVRNWLPAYLDDYDPWIGETPSDTPYAAVDGDDPLADMLVGRLSVTSAAELTTVVNKILAYEATPPGDWQRRFVFATDDAPDPAGNFYQLSDDVIADLFPLNMEVVRAYMEKKSNSAEQNAEALRIRDLIADTLNNDGAVMMQYVGHGNKREWAFPLIWTVSTRNDVDLLQNSVYPMSLTWTCWDNYYIEPTYQSLSEEMVFADGKGAVATFGPTGLDTTDSHDWLTRGFYSALFDAGMTGFGELTMAAKVYLYQYAPYYSRLLYTFMLQGDPALHFPCLLFGDVDGDGEVTAADLGVVTSQWGQLTGWPGDIDGDGKGTVIDAMLVVGQWGKACTTAGAP